MGEKRREAKQKVNRVFCFENVVLNPNPIIDYKTKLRHNDV